MSFHVKRYEPDCKCSHHLKAAEKAHAHYTEQMGELLEANRRLAEPLVALPPAPPPRQSVLPNIIEPAHGKQP
jgi:predicted anti-sigma-YlaC factor YlaD